MFEILMLLGFLYAGLCHLLPESAGDEDEEEAPRPPAPSRRHPFHPRLPRHRGLPRQRRTGRRLVTRAVNSGF